MAVTLETTGKRYRGLSTDGKPGVNVDAVGDVIQRPTEGSVFTEIDTGVRYIYHVGEWIKQPQTLETLLSHSIEIQSAILAQLKATHSGHESFSWDGETVDVDDNE